MDAVLQPLGSGCPTALVLPENRHTVPAILSVVLWSKEGTVYATLVSIGVWQWANAARQLRS